jgi:hypothetical protein
VRLWWASGPKLNLGSIADHFPFLPDPLTLDEAQIATHKHVIGVSGVGKSKLLEAMFLQLFEQGIGVSLLDPHSDSAEALLATLTAKGYFDRPGAHERLLYIDFADETHSLPFNVLNQPVEPHTLASTVLDAMHRCWPALGDGAAPQFDNLVLAGVLVLIENHHPLPMLHTLLTNKPVRDDCLSRVSDPDVVAFFTDRFDRWAKTETPQMIESTLRRLFLLTFSPILKHALGCHENALDFRKIIDSGTSVLFNLGGVHDQDARRLLGCLITLGYETAALSRTDLAPSQRRLHHLLLDEFSDYSAQSEEALSRTLSMTRKFGVFCVMAHQTWSQASARLQGALQNVGVTIAMRVGREDAEILAKRFGSVDALQVKSEPHYDSQHPIFLEQGFQWESWVATLTDLPARHALVKLSGGKTATIKTRNVASYKVDPDALAAVKQGYRSQLLRPREAFAPLISVPQSAPIRPGGLSDLT